MFFDLPYALGTRTPASMAKLAIIRMTMAVGTGSGNMKHQLYGSGAAFVNCSVFPSS